MTDLPHATAARGWRGQPQLAAAGRRALPTHDASIQTLTAEQRAVVSASWYQRAQQELAASAIFAVVAQGLVGLAPEPVRWLAARAVLDEMRHAEICRHVAWMYAQRELTAPSPPIVSLPHFGDADVPTRNVLYAVLSCAITELVGGAVLNACLDDVTGVLVERALRELLSDEVDHGRIGIGLLAPGALRPRLRQHVAAALPTLLRLGREAWYSRLDQQPQSAPPGHGCLTPQRLKAVVDDAFANLVTPAFEHLGFEVAAT